MPTILFGSISTLADTSELQRQAFNHAFDQHGLDWRWDQPHYQDLLTGNGGAARIAAFAAERGDAVDAAAVHRSKSDLFQQSLTDAELMARPGVVDTIQQARSHGSKVALVTTTTPENVAALLTALAPDVTADDFDVVLDLTDVSSAKPDPAVYRLALERLGVPAGSCLAIEDNVGGVASAVAAGITCLAFPNQNTAGHDFAQAAETVDRVSFARAGELVTSR